MTSSELPASTARRLKPWLACNCGVDADAVSRANAHLPPCSVETCALLAVVGRGSHLEERRRLAAVVSLRGLAGGRADGPM